MNATQETGDAIVWIAWDATLAEKHGACPEGRAAFGEAQAPGEAPCHIPHRRRGPSWLMRPAARALQCPRRRPKRGRITHEENIVMLYWAAVFFIIALVAALFGFGGLAAGAV